MIFTEKEMIAFKRFKGNITEFKEQLKKLDEHEKIVKIVCDEMNFPVNKLGLKTRKREVAFTRQMVHWSLYYWTFMTTPKIGKMIGNKNHATVLHSYETVDDLIDTDKGVRKLSENLEAKFTENDILRKFSKGEKRYSKW